MGLPKQEPKEGQQAIPIAATVVRTPQGGLHRWVSLVGGALVEVEHESLAADQTDINAFLGWASSFDIGAAMQVHPWPFSKPVADWVVRASVFRLPR
jgi:hypothetical protein